MNLSRPEQLAEVPAVPERKRLADDLHVLATTVEHLLPISAFTDDAVYLEAQRLAYWLGVQLEAAGRQRAFDHCEPLAWEPPQPGEDEPLTSG